MLAPALAALLLAMGDPAPPADPAPPPPPPSAAVDGWRHALSLSWEGTALWTKPDSNYGFGSIGVSYLVSTAASGVFVHLTFLFPFRASQDGVAYATGDWYSPSLGLDLLAGWEWRWELPHRIELEAGPGLHGSLLTLTGKPNVRSFNAAPLGIGGQVTGRWRPGSGDGSGLSLGVVVAPTVDFWDPLHSSQLKFAMSIRTGVVVGWDVR